MKRNLLMIIIVALLVVNIALSGIIMFSTVSTNNKTKALINDIATVLELDLATGQSSEESTAPSILDTETYNIADEMVIALQHGSDDEDHYVLCSVSLTMNKTHEDYAQYQPLIAANESKIKSVIIDVIGKHTKEEVMNNTALIQEEMTKKVQEIFGSDFVYEVYFRDIKCQ